MPSSSRTGSEVLNSFRGRTVLVCGTGLAGRSAVRTPAGGGDRGPSSTGPPAPGRSRDGGARSSHDRPAGAGRTRPIALGTATSRRAGAGLVVGFVVPFLFADVLRLPKDLYYGVYIASVLLFFVAWARATGQRLDLMVRRRWRSAVVLGVVAFEAWFFLFAGSSIG